MAFWLACFSFLDQSLSPPHFLASNHSPSISPFAKDAPQSPLSLPSSRSVSTLLLARASRHINTTAHHRSTATLTSWASCRPSAHRIHRIHRLHRLHRLHHHHCHPLSSTRSDSELTSRRLSAHVSFVGWSLHLPSSLLSRRVFGLMFYRRLWSSPSLF